MHAGQRAGEHLGAGKASVPRGKARGPALFPSWALDAGAELTALARDPPCCLYRARRQAVGSF